MFHSWFRKVGQSNTALVNFVGESCSSSGYLLLLAFLSNLQKALVLVQSRKAGRWQWRHPYVKAHPTFKDPVTVRDRVRSSWLAGELGWMGLCHNCDLNTLNQFFLSCSGMKSPMGNGKETKRGRGKSHSNGGKIIPVCMAIKGFHNHCCFS